MDNFYKLLWGTRTSTQSPNKSCEERNSEKAIGIDLGTTYSCIGIWNSAKDRVDIIANEHGNRTTPSMVAFNDHERLIGQSAMNQLSSNPSNTIFDAKRLIGRRYSDSIVQSDKGHWPFSVIRGPHNKPLIQVTFKNEEKKLMAEEISSIVLGKMKEIAENYLGCKVGKAVITVPAYFNNSQRQATRDAGKIAGLEVMRLLNEPTAAAIAYLSDKQESEFSEKGEYVVVYDLGGGTFDVALLHVKGKNDIVVKAVKGDTHLGGQDFDYRLVNHFVQEFNRKSKADISGNPKALRRLKSACERAKRELSSSVIAIVEVPCIQEGKDLVSKISRAKFEQINEDLFEKTIGHVEECLKDAKVKKEDIDSVVMVGGSSRIAKVEELLRDFFGTRTKINKDINPDEAVGCGAAIMAANLDGEHLDFSIKDVTPLSLGPKIRGDIMSIIIPRNTPIPVKMEETYVTIEDYQTEIPIDVYEGERPNVNDNLFLNSFTFVGVPKAEKGVERVKVCMEIDNNGILTVSAIHEATNKKESLRVTAQYGGLMDDEIADMIEAAKRLKLDDEKWKEAAKLKNGIEDAIYDGRKQLKPLKGTISISEMKYFQQFMMDAEEWLSENEDADKEKLLEKLEEIVHVCESIIEKKTPDV